MDEQRPEDDLRTRAVESLERKNRFWLHFVAYIVGNGALIVAWAVAGGGLFWPVVPIFGWGIGVIYHAWSVFWAVDTDNEQRIQQEMDRLRREGE